MCAANFGTDMPKDDREEALLAIFAELSVPLPPVLVYRILRVRGATFGKRTVMRYCSDLAAEGLRRRVDPAAMEDGRLEPISSEQKGYYLITEQGRDRVSSR